MSKQSLKATIDANIKQNGIQAITGQIMNSVLNQMVDDLAEEASTTEKLSELDMQNGVFQYDPWESISLVENKGKYLAYPENILVNMSGYSYSNPVRVNKEDVVVFRAAGMANNVAMIAITDETASYYKSVCVANISSKKDYSYVVQEDGYIAFCWQTAGGYKLMKSSSAVLLYLLKDDRIQYQINVGKFISAEGLLVNNSEYCYTSAIEVKKGNTYLIKGVGVANNVAMVSLTDEALSYFIPITIYPISGVIYEYAFVADEDGFIVFSFRKNLTNEIRNITDKVFLSQKDADITEKYLGASREVVSLVENKGKYLAYPENILVNMPGYSYSNPVKVSKGDVIEFYAAGAANNVILLAKTDETASSFFPLIVSASNYIKYYRNVITQDGYVVFCWDNTKSIKAYINHSETIKAILVENKTTSSDPLANINQPFTHIRCFKKITCIGDSLTQGVFDTTGHDVELMDYSYPAFLAKHTGIDVRNLGLGGDTASRQDSVRSWFDQANARNLLIEENIGDAVIIALGTNDISLYGEFTGNVDTDIDFSNRENNALTSVGGYANIIQYVRSIRPKSVIFMVTLSNTRNTLAQRNAMNEKVRALCQKFDNCYLIDMQMYAETTPEELSFFNTYYKNGEHNNALGYEYRARQTASYIDWIIANNLADFANIQFIDTSYTYDK